VTDEVWIGLEQNVINAAINEWRKCLRAEPMFVGQHFKHFCRQLKNGLLEFKRSKLRFLKTYILCKRCHTQVVQVHLQAFWRNSLLKCVSQPEITKISLKNFYFESSRSFKVINVDTNKKLVTIACYDKQQVCAYLPPFSSYTR